MISTLENKTRPVEILLVEDNHGDTVLVKRAFKKTIMKNNITVIASGEEALNVLQKKSKETKTCLPDLILLDLNLPGIKGLDVLKGIKQDKALKHIPVFILSSSMADQDVLNCYKNHANCYLNKSHSAEKLVELIEKLEQFWFTQVILPG